MIVGDIQVTGGYLLAFIIAVAWICATIGSIATKSSKPFDYAVQFSFLAGIGYLLLR